MRRVATWLLRLLSWAAYVVWAYVCIGTLTAAAVRYPNLLVVYILATIAFLSGKFYDYVEGMFMLAALVFTLTAVWVLMDEPTLFDASLAYYAGTAAVIFEGGGLVWLLIRKKDLQAERRGQRQQADDND